MHHHVAHAQPGTRLFDTWEEGFALWSRLIAATQGLQAACLMPNHFHVLSTADSRAQLGRAMQGYANWRNRRRGARGAAWHRSPPVACVSEIKHQRATERYVHRNPRKDRLVDDPLTWPFSTYRDAVGLAWTPLRRAADDPAWYHRETLRDARSPNPESRLPRALGPSDARAVDLRAIAVTTCAWTSTPPSLLRRAGPARRLFIQAARAMGQATNAEIAAYVGVSEATVYRHRPLPVEDAQRFALLLGDPRFDLFDRPPPGPDWKFKV